MKSCFLSDTESGSNLANIKEKRAKVRGKDNHFNDA